ncbi:MAG: septum formation protein Maf [Oscillospiraceae bacterium]|nr:septum formation protein Maf [Oscillospiraceae bacterium]
MQIVLASKSPRRIQLLTELGMEFTVIPAKGEAKPDPALDPGSAVEFIAAEKALDTAGRCAPGDLIIAADTLVYIDGELLGKPHTEDEARSMLSRLSGRSHEVYTGIALIFGGKKHVSHERTKVTFAALSESDIAWYVSTGEPMDKAGAYGAQGKGAALIEGIEGDFFNVMGLPVHRLVRLIESAGFSLSDIIKR